VSNSEAPTKSSTAPKGSAKSTSANPDLKPDGTGGNAPEAFFVLNKDADIAWRWDPVAVPLTPYGGELVPSAYRLRMRSFTSSGDMSF
jgi:hypothetical protein